MAAGAAALAASDRAAACAPSHSHLRSTMLCPKSSSNLPCLLAGCLTAEEAYTVRVARCGGEAMCVSCLGVRRNREGGVRENGGAG